MTVKLLTGLAGANYSYSPQSVVDLDPDLERRLIESGQAEPVHVPVKPVGKPRRKAAINKVV